MARIFITGSHDGLGLMLGQLLAEEHHEVVLHARTDQRAVDTRRALPAAHDVLVADVSTLAGMRTVADAAAAHGRFDAVVHNVAIGYQEPRRRETEDGLSELWAINVLAPYVLTALMERPARLIYLTSGMARGAQDTALRDTNWTARRWNGAAAYSESKYQDVLLTLAVARHWPSVVANAVTPGWVATRMGGPGAPDDLDLAHRTQAWLATSEDPDALITGRVLYHGAPAKVPPGATDVELQERLLAICRAASGIALPHA